MADTLPEKQQRILEYLQYFLDQKGYPPSIRDMQRACHISSTSVVEYHLRALERTGRIRRDPEVSRGVELLDGGRRLVPVPIIGTIAAGQPIPVPDSDTWSGPYTGESIAVSAGLVRGGEGVFGLRVKGYSMVDALINDGDIVLMRTATTAEDGDLVAVWLKEEGEVTLKRLYREARRIRLQPANSQMQPIYADPSNMEIQGRVIGVIRWLG